MLWRYWTGQAGVSVPRKTPTRYCKTRLLCEIALLPQNLSTVLRGFIHEVTHLGMRGLDVRREPVLVQPFGGRWPDRRDQHSRKAPAHSDVLIHFSRNLK